MKPTQFLFFLVSILPTVVAQIEIPTVQGYNAICLPVADRVGGDGKSMIANEILQSLNLPRTFNAEYGGGKWKSKEEISSRSVLPHCFALYSLGKISRFNDIITIISTGPEVSTFHLQQGFNMIGLPFNPSGPYSTSLIGLKDTLTNSDYTLNDAVTQGLLLDSISHYNGKISKNNIVQEKISTSPLLEVGKGYFIYAKKANLQVEFTKTPQITESELLPIVAYSFENNVNDNIGDHHGQLKNGATFTQGVKGKALSLDGVDDYVSIPDSDLLDIDTTFTLSVWVYPKSYGKTLDQNSQMHAGILNKDSASDRGLNLMFSGDQINFHVFANDNSFESLVYSAPPLNQWSHIAVNYDGNHMNLYRNGGLVAAKTVGAKTWRKNSQPLLIGYQAYSSQGRRFDGSIDQVKIFKNALSHQQIQQLFTELPTVVQTNLISWHKFENSFDDELVDHPGTQFGAIQFAEGQLGKAAVFDGVDDYINIGGEQSLSFGGSSPFSIDAWVARSPGGVMLSKYNGGVEGEYTLSVGDGGITFHREIYPWGLQIGHIIPLNVFRHLAFTYDGTTMRIYSNGELIASEQRGPQNYATHSPVLIGVQDLKGNPNPATFFKGKIDDLKIYNRGLTSTEVVQNCKAGGGCVSIP